MGEPRSAIVVGAGIVGLSTAWFLQERDIAVTVIDRVGVAAGASWGNAGWIAPALSVPLNDPRMLRYALRSLPNRHGPVRIPPSLDPTLWRFLLRFVANCRESSWQRAVRHNLTRNLRHTACPSTSRQCIPRDSNILAGDEFAQFRLVNKSAHADLF